MTSSSPASPGADERRREARSFARYLVAGVVNTIASYGLFVALELVLPYLAAYAVAYVAGIALSYVLNTRMVFRVPQRWSTFIRFPVVYLVQFLVGSTAMVILVEAFGIDPRIAALLALIVTVPVTYLAARYVLRRPPAESDA
jgi:putative flippase GtrA